MQKLMFSVLSWLSTAVVMVSGGTGNGIVSWGLSGYGQEITPQVSPLGAELLARYQGCYVGDTQQKEVYFTFDLGYEAGYTAEVLDILKEYQAQGVFFLCGNYLQQTALIERMYQEGHQVGNHTDQHRDLPTLSEAAIRQDLSDLQLPQPAKFFRPPQGRFDEKTLRVAQDLGLRAVLWSIAIVDWQQKPAYDVAAAVAKVQERLHPGAIILFHLTNPSAPAMLRALLPALQERGYTWGQLS